MSKSFNVFIIMLVSILLLGGCVRDGGKTAEEVMNAPEMELEPLREDEDHLLSTESAKAEAEEDSVGLMAFYPNGSGPLAALAGMNTFTLYFEHDDVERGEGRIGLYDTDATEDPLVSAVDVNDADRVELLPIDENGKNISNFDNGSMAVIRFDRRFEAGRHYYVLLDGGCFKRGDIVSTGIANASYITFSVKPYGIDTALSTEYGEGEDVRIHVLLGGEAEAAGVLEYNSQFLTFDPATISSSTDMNIHFNRTTAENLPASCTLAFYNKGGQRIDSCVFSLKIVEKGDLDLHSAGNNVVDATEGEGSLPD